MEFDWDPAKREANLGKHGIDFRDAIAVFKDAQHILEDTSRSEFGERRTKAIGRVGSTSAVRDLYRSRRASKNHLGTEDTKR
ncbi:MAG: BrnT family toxin [Chloroflexi bacterium]|nr:BrnT family toxin [Chloroflexota bacterium]